MMILVLNNEALANIITNANKAKAVFKDVISTHGEDLTEESLVFHAFMYSFLVFAQAILTLSNFIIVKRKLGAPRNFYESLQLLIEEDIINIEDSEDIAKLLVDLRDEILHGNLETTIEKIKYMIQNFPKFERIYEILIDEIKKYLNLGN